jgi:hypothetical protein
VGTGDEQVKKKRRPDLTHLAGIARDYRHESVLAIVDFCGILKQSD